jgi:hypothetical protein
MKDLYERAFKKCDYQPNLCQFSNNYRNYVWFEFRKTDF